MPSLTSNKPLRVGVLGYSDVFRRKFANALMNSRKATLTAIASRNPQCIQVSGADLITKQMTYEEMIVSPDIDMVYVSLPNHLHEKWTVDALQHGKHVLCEKPLGLSADSVGRMLDAADDCRLLLYENIMYLRHPQHHEVKKIIDDGKIGRIKSLRCVFTIPPLAESNFRMNKDNGGGAFHDLNRYPFSAAQFFLKGCRHQLIRRKSEILNGLNLSMTGETITDLNEHFLFEIAFGRPYQSYYEVTGSRGFIRVERAFTTPQEINNTITVRIGGRDESITASCCDHFMTTIDHVCEIIQAGSWCDVHRRTRSLGIFAEMFNTGCGEESLI